MKAPVESVGASKVLPCLTSFFRGLAPVVLGLLRLVVAIIGELLVEEALGGSFFPSLSSLSGVNSVICEMS